MDNTISFTVNQLIGFITTVGGCIIVIEAVVLIEALEEENKSRKEEIEELRKEMKNELEKRDERLNTGDDRFEKFEEGNKTIMRGLQALLNQSLGIKDTEALKKASEELSEFLLNK